MDGGLFGQQEASADPRGVGAERQDRRQAASVGHAPGGDHRHRVDRVDDARDEHQRGHLSPNPAARFPPLGHDDVNARGDRVIGFGSRPDAVQM